MKYTVMTNYYLSGYEQIEADSPQEAIEKSEGHTLNCSNKGLDMGEASSVVVMDETGNEVFEDDWEGGSTAAATAALKVATAEARISNEEVARVCKQRDELIEQICDVEAERDRMKETVRRLNERLKFEEGWWEDLAETIRVPGNLRIDAKATINRFLKKHGGET